MTRGAPCRTARGPSRVQPGRALAPCPDGVRQHHGGAALEAGPGCVAGADLDRIGGRQRARGAVEPGAVHAPDHAVPALRTCVVEAAWALQMSPFSPVGAKNSPPKPACVSSVSSPGCARARRAGCPPARLWGLTSNQLGAAVSRRGTRRAEALLRQIRSVPETWLVSSWVEPSMDCRSSHCR